MQKISEKGLSMQLNKILDRAEADMWSQIRTVFETAVDSAQEKLESYLKGTVTRAYLRLLYVTNAGYRLQVQL